MSIIDSMELLIEEVAQTNLEAKAAYDAAKDMLEEGLMGPREYGYMLGYIINQYK